MVSTSISKTASLHKQQHTALSVTCSLSEAHNQKEDEKDGMQYNCTVQLRILSKLKFTQNEGTIDSGSSYHASNNNHNAPLMLLNYDTVTSQVIFNSNQYSLQLISFSYTK
jgi:hypothetical protein